VKQTMVAMLHSLRVLQGTLRACGFPRAHMEALGCEQTGHGNQRAKIAMCNSAMLRCKLKESQGFGSVL